MPVTLLVVAGSQSCAVAERAAQVAGVRARVVRRRALAPALAEPVLRLDDRERARGAAAILAALDDLSGGPPPAPDGAEARRADTWGEEVWQPLAGRLWWRALRGAPPAAAARAIGVRPRLAGALVRAQLRIAGADDGTARADLRSLAGHLWRIDDWIARGVLGGAHVGAADLQVAVATRLLLAVADLAPLLDGRPAAPHARAVFPEPAAPAPGALPVRAGAS